MRPRPISEAAFPYTIAIVALCVALAVCREGFSEWYEYKPAGSVDGHGILYEMLSRCPQYGLRQIVGFDRATQCHEATHFVNGVLSGFAGQEYGAFYVGGGKVCILPPPKLTIGIVAQYVPQQQRSARYRQYLCGGRASRSCLSVIDEWVCYTNDAQCTKEMRLPDDGGLNRAQEFSGFADALVQAVETHDPTYAGMARLREFVVWQKERVQRLTGKPIAGAR